MTYVFPTHLQIWNWELGILVLSCTSKFFHNSQKDSKLRFLNVALARLLSFSLFMEGIENWDFWILAETLLPNISQVTKQLGNWDFWSSLAFIFSKIIRIIFWTGYMWWVGESIFFYETILWQFKCWKYCFQP